MKREQLEKLIKESWSIETCYPPLQSKWSAMNPSLGQCAVTSLLLQDYLGGEILYDANNDHYWNKLSDGKEIDLTRNQFPKGTLFSKGEVIERENLFSATAQTRFRYELLQEKASYYLES